MLATDKRTWKVVGVILAAILTPFLLMIFVICSMLSGTASHNNTAVELTFFGGAIPGSVPAEYRGYIVDMRSCFAVLDEVIAERQTEMNNENNEDDASVEANRLDANRVKAVFYALFFGSEPLQLSPEDAREFVECFVSYEERAQTVILTDGDGNPYVVQETCLAAVPIRDLPVVYANISAYIGRAITAEDSANITEIYLRVAYRSFDVGADVSLEGGNGTHDLIGELTKDSDVVPSAGGFVSPLAGGWRDKVTSGFGYRKNPTGSGSEGHTGLDMGVPVGTPVLAVKGGRVLFVRYQQAGYGYHVAIDHGGGLVTLYAHCSEILVTEGQTVRAGDVIAKSGNTGRSTGPHLHLEVMQDGVPQDPGNYL